MTGPLSSLTIEDVARFPRPGTVVPARLGFTPDSKAVTYLFSAEGSLVRSLWRYDIATGERTVLAGPPPARQFSRDEELRRERMRLREVGVTDYAFATNAAALVLMVPMGGAVFVSVGGGPLAELPGTAGAIDPRLSPDGSWVAFVRDGNLFVANLGTGALSQLTHDAEDGLTNGLAEFIAQEELDRARGFWWSEDGARIAYQQADERHIPIYPIVHQGKDTVEIENHRYPFAGAANATVRLATVDVASGATSWLDLGDETDIYLARAGWRPSGKFTAQILDRDQVTLRLLEFDGGEASVLHEERSEPWLNVSGDTRFLKSGEILWSSEKTGYRHLSLLAADGAPIGDLTGGDWVVTHVIGVDEERRLVYFSGTRDGVTRRQVYAVPLDGGEVRAITSGEGWHDGVLSPDGRQLIEFVSSMAHAPTIALVEIATGARTPLFENEGATAAALGLAVPVFGEFPAADGTPLHTAVYLPAEIEPGRRYPVVVSVYGGPHAQRVANDWSMTVDLRAQYLAQQGCIVLKVDNRGSANRGLAFEGHLHRDMGSVEVEDQVAAVRWLGETYPFADTSRVGVYGWSYGGYMTLMCLAKEPAVFKVGVAGAPVTHWDGYDTGYTERYMSTPQKNPDGYRRSAAMEHIAGLTGKLLIVHGMIDENVHFRHTARLLVALASAGKEYETLLYPEERHMPRDQRGLEDQERKVLGFLLRHL